MDETTDPMSGAQPTLKTATAAVHAGVWPGPDGGVSTPIELSTTFRQQSVGAYERYDYARAGNPTRAALEEAVATLEGAAGAYAYASGLAAIDAVVRTLSPGDEVIVGLDAYGGTWRLLTQVWQKWGLTVTAVDLTDPDALDAGWTDQTAMVLAETPTNPLLSVIDVQAVASVCHHHGGTLVVDSTFATPALLRPVEWGADVVVHSSTKYLGGHSDVVGGVAATCDEALGEQLSFLQKASGAVPGPFDCFLVLRGLRTLDVRMQRHCENALLLVDAVAGHPLVQQVHHPSLEGHPGHDAAARQMSGYGGMVSLELTDADTAVTVAESMKVFTLAESLGGVESLVEVPAAMTHASTTGTPLEVPDTVVRLSVGIEDGNDLVDDILQALNAAVQKR
jgi:cystathionine gamma-synthase